MNPKWKKQKDYKAYFTKMKKLLDAGAIGVPKLKPYQEAMFAGFDPGNGDDTVTLFYRRPQGFTAIQPFEIGPRGAFAIERFNHLTRHGYKLDLVRGVYVKS